MTVIPSFSTGQNCNIRAANTVFENMAVRAIYTNNILVEISVD
jgi:hypothetical protein